MLEMIRSGAQTGADRAAIDVAIEHGIKYAGYVPKGGWTEDYPNPPGILPYYSELMETEDENPVVRTMLNVAESDGTLIISGREGSVSQGTEITIEVCRRLEKPCLVVSDVHQIEEVNEWVLGHSIRTLNVAGPRESESPGIQGRAMGVLEGVLKQLIVRDLVVFN